MAFISCSVQTTTHLILRSGPQARVSKDGQQQDWGPPFETQRYALLLRVRLYL